MDSKTKETAEKFVNDLLASAEDVPINVKDNVNEFPAFCNKELFKKGQNLLFKYSYCPLMSKYLGLLACLAVESCRNVLKITGGYGTAYKAYRRYVGATQLIFVWYFCNTRPNSRFWKSINIFNSRHKHVKNVTKAHQQNRLSQKDLALMQFGFMGFLMTRPRQIAFDTASKEEVEGLNHMWYILGYMLGLEDRFNICNGSVEETRAICELLIEKVYLPAIKRKDKEFLEMTAEASKALWYVDPLFQNNVCLSQLYNFLTGGGVNETTFLPLTFRERYHLKYNNWSLSIYRWTVFRFIINCLKRIQVIYFTYVPFVAAIKFG